MIKFTIFFAAIVASLFFYSVRCRKPFRYGCGEIFVGFAVIYFVLTPVETNYILRAAGEPGLSETFLPKAVGVLAGIYVLVRGLDNMSRDLPISWLPWWNWLFITQR